MKNLSTNTDYELVKLYENGNDNAFDELLQRHQNYVYSYILFLVKDEEITVPHRNNTSVVNSPPTARAGGEVWRERGWQSQLLLGAPK